MTVTGTATRLDKSSFLKSSVAKRLLLLNVAMALFYFVALSFFFTPGNIILFSLLIFGEIFHVFQIIGFTHSIWDTGHSAPFDNSFVRPVDVFITVCGEPVEVVRETAQACLAMKYPAFEVFILNDGYVAKRDNWQQIEALAKELGITCVTRQKPGGAKAGNINHALTLTSSPYIAVFDADHVPHQNFLSSVMGYFANSRMGFVQTPQFYKNQGKNLITQTAWHQQALFFAPIMSGKNRNGSAFMCGTNMAIRRTALLEAGGMCETNIAEDFLTSLFIHAKGWKSVYVPKVLAEGLAPEDFLSYYKQQFRWSRGNLEVIFKYNPLFMKGLHMGQRWQYIFSSSYYLSGLVVVLNALLPLIFLFTGITAIETSTMALALIFIPYIFLSLYVLQKSSNASYSFSAISFSVSSFYLQITAIIAVLTKQKTSFSVTSKSALEGNFLYLARPHIIYIVISVVGLGVGLLREGLSPSLLANLAWVVINIVLFVPFIAAAAYKASKAVEPTNSKHDVPMSTLASEKVVR